jgi:hypothetical protein
VTGSAAGFAAWDAPCTEIGRHLTAIAKIANPTAANISETDHS